MNWMNAFGDVLRLVNIAALLFFIIWLAVFTSKLLRENWFKARYCSLLDEIKAAHDGLGEHWGGERMSPETVRAILALLHDRTEKIDFAHLRTLDAKVQQPVLNR